MSKGTFIKPALTPEQLLFKLKEQGLVVENDSVAKTYLQFVGGFRLKAYWHPYQDLQTKRFLPTTTFLKIVDEYEFDRGLRAVAFAAIERLEIAIRTTIANRLAISHGPHWYLKSGIFKPTSRWTYGQLLAKIEREVGLSERQAFISTYNHKYDDPYIPQSWAVAECVSFGFWSKTYKILRHKDDKKAVSKKFGVDTPEVFESWIHAISHFRNVIAHHERLIRTQLAIQPQMYGKSKIVFKIDHHLQNTSIFAVLTIMSFLSNAIGLPSTLKGDLIKLFRQYSAINIAEIGFPDDWQTYSGW